MLSTLIFLIIFPSSCLNSTVFLVLWTSIQLTLIVYTFFSFFHRFGFSGHPVVHHMVTCVLPQGLPLFSCKLPYWRLLKGLNYFYESYCRFFEVHEFHPIWVFLSVGLCYYQFNNSLFFLEFSSFSLLWVFPRSYSNCRLKSRLWPSLPVTLLYKFYNLLFWQLVIKI